MQGKTLPAEQNYVSPDHQVHFPIASGIAPSQLTRLILTTYMKEIYQCIES